MSLDGLKDLSDDSGQSTNDTSSSGGSSSSSSDDGPQTELRVPYMVVYVDEDGRYQYASSPQDEDLMLEFERESRSDGWSLACTPSYIKRYWMSHSSFKTAAHIVKEVTGNNLTSMLERDPEKALTAVIESAKVYDTDRDIPQTRDCPVCGAELHRIYDDYDTVNNKRVCSDHTISELSKSGVMDQSGVPSNRMWE